MATTTLRELVTESAAQTEAAGERLARCLGRGDLVLLEGELGAGKTTLVRGLARGMGCRGEVMSPTFQLVRIYPGPVPLAHVDLYRVERTSELCELGLEDLLEDGAAVVEWGDRLEGFRTAWVVIEALDLNRRRLRLQEAPASWSW